MGKFYETIPEDLITWVLEQNVFWVASAPLSASGHVNLSPKGGKGFGVIDEKTFWYCDLTGSGVETTSHLHEPGNGRIVIMFNAFEGAPKIIRFWGKGRVLEYGTREFEDFTYRHDVKRPPGLRSIIIVDIHQVGSSCGYSMPFYDFVKFRPTLDNWAQKREAADQAGNEEEGLERYWAFKNQLSMDNLPGLTRGVSNAARDSVAPMPKMVGPYAPPPLSSSLSSSPSSTPASSSPLQQLLSHLHTPRNGKGKMETATVTAGFVGFVAGVMVMVLLRWLLVEVGRRAGGRGEAVGTWGWI